jgi:uncharacterized protein (DUF433 family)
MTTEVLRTAKSWIQKTPEICGGAACIRDTCIPVWSLAVAHQLGATDEELRSYFVTPLTAADIEAAWEYEEQHAEEISQAIRENEEA